jgi:hypothetical protein
MSSERRCGESVSWHGLSRCGKPAAWIVRGAIVMYRCAIHAERYRRPGYTLKVLRHAH